MEYKEYRNEKSELHRGGGLPAREFASGDKEWWVNGKRHRETPLGCSDGVGELPAYEWANGDKAWYVNGVLHRSGGLPAIERANGDKFWYFNGQLHRSGGLPAIDRANGDKLWHVNGKLHRDGGLPAREWANGCKEWWVNGVNITSFRNKYHEVHRIRAQKRIYFWIIQLLYRPGSDSAKRLAEASWQKTLKEMEEFQN
jgi:hypothetical protein